MKMPVGDERLDAHYTSRHPTGNQEFEYRQDCHRSSQQQEPKYKLAELLAEITDENLHEEWNVGPSVGREIW